MQRWNFIYKIFPK